MNPITMDVNRERTSRTLQRRLRETGVLLVHCDSAGQKWHESADPNRRGQRADLGTQKAVRQSDWLEQLLIASPMAQKILIEACSNWSRDDEPQPCELVPGVWMEPIRLLNRRKHIGYAVFIVPTDHLPASEHLVQLCQSAELDFTLTQRMLTKAPLVPRPEIGRVLSLARYLYEGEQRILADERTIESTGQQLAESYEEISLLYTIIQSMSVVQQPSHFVSMTCEELLGVLPYRWIGARMAHDAERLKKLAGRLIVVGEPRVDEQSLQELTSQMLAEHQAGNEPSPASSVAPASFGNRTSELAARVLEPHQNIADEKYRALGRTVLVQPVTSDGRVIGLLIAGDKSGPDQHASSVDLKLLGASASNMAIFLENAALYDDLNAMFLGTLEALTASIDAKDRYTCGHSRRVAHLTQQIAREIGMKEVLVKRMHVAGLVHDVGKIGVPEHVLLKPGKLTREEFDWIRRHPEMGYRILKDIPQLKDLLPGVLYHHERWDGRGYPEGLKGEEIPMIARLIGLADAFDAMSSTRTYRDALKREEVLEEITRCAGTQFDPELAAAFVRMDFSEYDRLVADDRTGASVRIICGDSRRGEAA